MVTVDYCETVRDLLTKHLEPRTASIDANSVYPEDFLEQLGSAGLFAPSSKNGADLWAKTLVLIEETAAVCGTTAFSVWCHTAAMVYVRNGSSAYLKSKILPLLERGERLGATGLSNPMKFYAGMEPIRLRAVRASNGYRISGFLPYVSNLGSNHWFGIVAELDTAQRVMAFVPCSTEGLKLTERKDFLGLNGSATFNCYFRDVFIPTDWILSDDADALINQILPEIVLNQAGIGFGLTRAMAEGIVGLKDKQQGVNRYLRQQPEELAQRLEQLRTQANQLIYSRNSSSQMLRGVLTVRLESSYLVLDTASSAMLHYGGAAYVRKSNASRRLREAYFVALVTPAVKQLEKMLQDDLAQHQLEIHE